MQVPFARGITLISQAFGVESFIDTRLAHDGSRGAASVFIALSTSERAISGVGPSRRHTE